MQTKNLFARNLHTSFAHNSTQFACMSQVHRGKIIETEIDRLGIQKSKLSRKVGRSNRTIYNDLDSPDLPIPIVIKYCQALRVDLSDRIPELIDYKDTLLQQQGDHIFGFANDEFKTLYMELDKWKTTAYKKSDEANKYRDKFFNLVMALSEEDRKKYLSFIIEEAADDRKNYLTIITENPT